MYVAEGRAPQRPKGSGPLLSFEMDVGRAGALYKEVPSRLSQNGHAEKA